MVIKPRIAKRQDCTTPLRQNNPSLAGLFLSFLRLGATAFGGPAMIPYIGTMAVEQKRWLEDRTFRDGVALCQSIPGATAMQAAAYVGFRTRGVVGAALSYIGFGLPAFFLMVGLSAIYARSASLPPVIALFSGLQTVVVAIVANATVSFGKSSLSSLRDAVVAAIAAAMFGAGTSPIWVILLAALLGLLLYKTDASPRSSVSPGEPSSSGRSVLIIAAAAASGFVLLFIFERKLFDLAAIMFRIDFFAFGGGFASVPLMFHEIVELRAWMDAQTFLNGIALGQITPGPIVITATFVGYVVYGLLGAIVATVSVFLPSFLIVVGVVPYFDRLRNSIYFIRAIRAILCSFVGLLLTVTFRFASNVSWDVPRVSLAAGAFVALLFKVEIIWIVIAGTVVSVFVL
ncbi:MAG TPA: chromate efflux transporter [Terriglobales bacterium]|nr:chromate efflux transporter [Terriglobales bacterium]